MELIKSIIMFMNNILEFLANNPFYPILILGAGIFLTITFKFTQFRYFKEGVKLMFSSNHSSEGTSPFKSAALAVGGRVGTGNVSGVTAAILTGGPGAIFWMWLVAFFGMATSFAESTLAQIYKEKTGEHVYVGGPGYYIEKGLGKKFRPLAIFYSIVMIFSFGLFYISVQISTIYSSSLTAFDIDKGSILANVIIFGLIILVGYSSFGGIKKLMNISSVFVPIMAVGYFILVGIIIIMNITFVPTFFQIVFTQAFTPEAFVGGGIGIIISTGVKRGIFSNEAGQGSGAIAGATSSTAHPVEQGFVQMITVFIDTFVVCSLTAFVIVLSMQGLSDDAIVNYAYSYEATEVASMAFEHSINLGDKLLALFLFFFASSSILALVAYGIQSVKYIFEKNQKMTKNALFVYSCLTIVMVLITPMLDTLSSNYPDKFDIFGMADNVASLLFYINIVVIILLTPKIKLVLKDYENKRKNNDEISFDREKFVKDNSPD